MKPHSAGGPLILALSVAGFTPGDRPLLRAAEPLRSDRGDLVHRLGSGSGALASPAAADPDLEPGFPVQALHTAGSYHGGPAIHTLVGNIDGDPELEIVVTSLATGPLMAWNHDGSVVSGWPVTGVSGAGYPALGNLSNLHAGLEVFSGHWGLPGRLAAWAGSGAALPGWPRDSANFVSTPPSLADVDGDGIDEVFVAEEDWQLHGYRADGSLLPGWPVSAALGTQERHTPAIADLDGDDDLEILTVTGWESGIAYLLAYHHDGTPVSGFPVSFAGYVDTFPVVGDVDGDGALEIVVAAPVGLATTVRIYSSNGALERTITASGGVPYGTAPALADLDGDAVPEIVVQTDGALHAWKGSGAILSGWPRAFAGRWLGSSGPVVGDVDGDLQPDIVVVAQVGGSSEDGDVRAYDRLGNLHPRFPKPLKIGPGAVPAIADIDLDGRNEIVVSGSFWNGVPGTYDKVWAYDLGGGPHGPVPWGQFMGGPRHHGLFPGGPGPLDYYTLPPCRAVDTRGTPGPTGGPALAAGADRIFTLHGVCAIPSTAQAVSTNIAVAGPTASGHLTMFRPGNAVPNSSAINYRAAQTRANNAIVRLSAAGQVTVRCHQASGTVHFILDVNGYFR